MRKIGITFLLCMCAAASSIWAEENKEKNKNADSEVIHFVNLGPAPNFKGIEHWINSPELNIANLKGKVVLIDFWTYSCINCVRTFPYLKSWYDKYKDKGFVIIGVHSPEFAFEKDTDNVEAAVKRFDIEYPVAQDNKFETWKAYDNQYWPAKYLINQQGDIVYTHFGEGDYEGTENAIRALLDMKDTVKVEEDRTMMKVGTPEIYLGFRRLKNLSPDQKPSPLPEDYVIPAKIFKNKFALGGNWKFEQEMVILVGNEGVIKLNFNASKVFMVAYSPNPIQVEVWIDGQKVNQVAISDHQLYTLFNSTEVKDHLLELKVEGAGFQAYTFTFG